MTALGQNRANTLAPNHVGYGVQCRRIPNAGVCQSQAQWLLGWVSKVLAKLPFLTKERQLLNTWQIVACARNHERKNWSREFFVLTEQKHGLDTFRLHEHR